MLHSLSVGLSVRLSVCQPYGQLKHLRNFVTVPRSDFLSLDLQCTDDVFELKQTFWN